MQGIFEILALAIASWMFAEGATPIQMLKEQLYNLFSIYEGTSIYSFFYELINCSLCSGFWIFLIYYQDWKIAMIGSILSEAISRINRHTL